MKIVKFDFDLYNIYDRLMEGVMVEVALAYDEDDVVKNGITEDNCTFQGYIFEPGSLSFVKRSPFDLARIDADIREYFTGDQLENYLAEEMPEEDYKVIEDALRASPNYREPVAVVGKAMSGTQFGDMLADLAKQMKDQ